MSLLQSLHCDYTCNVLTYSLEVQCQIPKLTYVKAFHLVTCFCLRRLQMTLTWNQLLVNFSLMPIILYEEEISVNDIFVDGFLLRFVLLQLLLSTYF